MLDSLSGDTWEDFRQRYNHTYCWLLRGNEKLFVYISDINPEAVRFSMGSSMSFSANADTGTMFQFIPVDRGWYNTDDNSVFHLSRVPERQFRRGISDGNTLIHDETMYNVELSYKKLKSIFGVEKQWSRPFDPQVPNAFSKHFAYLPAYSSSLVFHNVVIGAWDGKVFEVDHNFVQEVSDVFRRNNLQLTIKGR